MKFLTKFATILAFCLCIYMSISTFMMTGIILNAIFPFIPLLMTFVGSTIGLIIISLIIFAVFIKEE